MDVFGVLSLLGGLALFLYGMTLMGEGLVALAGTGMERLLKNVTASDGRAVLAGAGVTAVLQSSSAVTVMVVGFVNAGLMELSQVAGIIMGANVGTTVTAWLLSGTGIKPSSFWVRLAQPTSFCPILAFAGVLLLMAAKREKTRQAAKAFLGFSILIFGMNAMSDAVKPLSGMKEVGELLLLFAHPLWGTLAGAALTALIQSSSASVGMLQVLCNATFVPYRATIPVIMGQNVGTCVTALLSAIGASKNAKRAALVHLYFNLLGVALVMALFYGINHFLSFPFLESAASGRGIAMAHSLFNIVSVLLLLPFSKGMVRLAELSVKE